MTPRTTPTIRPRFTVEEARVLLAAMHLFARQERTPDVIELHDKVQRMADSLEAKEPTCQTS